MGRWTRQARDVEFACQDQRMVGFQTREILSLAYVMVVFVEKGKVDYLVSAKAGVGCRGAQ